MQKECRESTLSTSPQSTSPLPEGKRKNALKMHKNVSNFKNFSPVAPIGTAGAIFLIKKVKFFIFFGKNTKFVIFCTKNTRKGAKFRKIFACGAYRHHRHHSFSIRRAKFFYFYGEEHKICHFSRLRRKIFAI